MGKSAFLTKRGNVFWFRRRPPVLRTVGNPFLTSSDRKIPEQRQRAASQHLALSLRTGCRTVARRRAARVAALFEYAWEIFEAAMNRMSGPSYAPDLQQAFARDLLDMLKKNVELAERIASTALPERAQAVLDRNDAATRRAIEAAVPGGTSRAEPQESYTGCLDDPEFEAALLKLADDRGWWHTDPGDIIADFDMMLVGLVAMQEEYVRYCARKGLDPATALPSLAKLAGGLTNTAQALGVLPAVPVASARQPARDIPAPRPSATVPKVSIDDSPPISEFGTRYLDLRCEGYTLKRKSETPDPAAGESFRANSRRNSEATIGLFVDLCGDLPTADIQEHHCKEFIDILPRIPAGHGKSAKDRRGIRQVVEDADRDEAREVEALRVRMRRAGNSPGEIEDAVAAARTARLRTETCVRHMRLISQLMEFAIFDGIRTDNPIKDLIWTGRKIKSRANRERTAMRMGWGDDINKLLASPIYCDPLIDPGEPLFWAPLLALFAGLRMEEALQLRADDFSSEMGVPYVAIRIADENQRLKTRTAERRIPIHRTLLDLGLLRLVELRQETGQGRIFIHLERGKNKGKLGENFSKRFTNYRKRHNLYERTKDFHGLRTDFQTRLTWAKVPEHTRKYLMGHEITDITHANYYRAGDPMPTLKEFVDRIDIECAGIRRPFPDLRPADGAPGLRLVSTTGRPRPQTG